MNRTQQREKRRESAISPVAKLAVDGLAEGGSGSGARRRDHLRVVEAGESTSAPNPADQFDTRGLRLEDEINPLILRTFAKWILQLAGQSGLGAAECDVIRKGLPVALPEALELREEIRGAKRRLEQVRKEARPLLEGTRSQWSRGGNPALQLKASQREALVDSAVDGAIAFLHAKERLRVLRARFALVVEGAVGAVASEARQRELRNVHQVTESVRWLLNDL